MKEKIELACFIQREKQAIITSLDSKISFLLVVLGIIIAGFLDIIGDIWDYGIKISLVTVFCTGISSTLIISIYFILFPRSSKKDYTGLFFVRHNEIRNRENYFEHFLSMSEEAVLHELLSQNFALELIVSKKMRFCRFAYFSFSLPLLAVVVSIFLVYLGV